MRNPERPASLHVLYRYEHMPFLQDTLRTFGGSYVRRSRPINLNDESIPRFARGFARNPNAFTTPPTEQADVQCLLREKAVDHVGVVLFGRFDGLLLQVDDIVRQKEKFAFLAASGIHYRPDFNLDDIEDLPELSEAEVALLDGFYGNCPTKEAS